MNANISSDKGKQTTLDGSEYEEPEDENAIFTENGITPETKCVMCEETAKQILEEYDRYAIIDSSYSEKLDGWVCFPCKESADSTPQGTVLIFNPNTNTVEKYVVMEHEDVYGETTVENPENLEDIEVECYDYGESPIQFKWHRTDAWRGYYEPEGEDWKVLHSDCILSYSEDAEELKKFDEDIKQVLWKLGYEFAIVFGRTSNLFSCGYDVLIKKSEEQDIIKQMAMYSKLMQLITKYRDSERFNITALTGSSKKTKEAKLLVKAYKRLKNGDNADEVMEDILSEV